MFNSVEKLIALRNLRPKKKEGFLKVISAFSFVGIMLGVAVLIIVMSVMNGFRTDLTNKILGFNPHLIIKPYNGEKIDSDFKKKISENLNKIEYLESFSGEGVVIKNETTKKITLIPEIKIKTDQLKNTSKVCPISGWAASNKAIIKVNKKESKYLK